MTAPGIPTMIFSGMLAADIDLALRERMDAEAEMEAALTLLTAIDTKSSNSRWTPGCTEAPVSTQPATSPMLRPSAEPVVSPVASSQQQAKQTPARRKARRAKSAKASFVVRFDEIPTATRDAQNASRAARAAARAVK